MNPKTPLKVAAFVVAAAIYLLFLAGAGYMGWLVILALRKYVGA